MAFFLVEYLGFSTYKIMSSVKKGNFTPSFPICCCCCCQVASVVFDSVWPQRRQPTRLHHPWDSPGKNTGVGCHFLLQCMKVKSESEVAQLCPTLSDSMNCSLPGSSIHGILQARILEWVAMAFSAFPIWMTFISFSWLISLGLSVLCWMEAGRVDILASSQRENFQFFTAEYNANHGSSYTVLRGVCS